MYLNDMATIVHSILSQVHIHMIGFVTWPPLFVPKLLYRWSSDKANHTCENML